MLFANFIANFIGVCVSFVVLRKADMALYILSQRIDMFFLPVSFILPFAITFWYELPIRRYLNLKYRGTPVPEEFSTMVRRRLLNEPFVLIAMDFGIWVTAAFVYSGVFWAMGADKMQLQRSLLGSLTIGLITITVAFFAFEFILRNFLAPYFFPDGGLYATPKTLRINIRTRLVALLFACNLIPFFSILHIVRRTFRSTQEPFTILNQIQGEIVTNSLIFMGVAVWLTFLVSSNLTRPFTEIIQVLRSVRRGQFGKKVRVTSNDEIGYTGDVINEMTEGLKERAQMRQSLDLAMDVQQNLLPQKNPDIDGLDIIGKSIYCDKTGGDYFDFLDTGDPRKGEISVVVGDVSDHGIPSALLMATARGSIRQRSSLPGSIGRIVSDVNHQLTRDVGESGQFMTLFYLTIELDARRLQWVRAGHDPAIFYDPNMDTFEDLMGAGMALGLDQDWQYNANEKTGLTGGQIILLGTDGIWEARNRKGEMFGKRPIYEIVRQNTAGSAKEILDQIIQSLMRFQEDFRPEDDVTLVVIKIDKSL
jgi:sigma-B regulation protein RsbU (phosphoserine phosphatase)